MVAAIVRDRSEFVRQYTSSRMSVPSYAQGGRGFSSGGGDVDFIQPLPTETPDRLDQYRELRDNVPDVSAAIWVWIRLCNSGYDVRVYNRNTREQTGQFDERLRELAQRADPNGGLDGFLNRLFLSYFTYGAFAGEFILNNARSDIAAITLIPVKTIRFGFKNKKGQPSSGRRVLGSEVPQAFQVISGEDPIELNPETFFYYALDPDEDNPYGRSLVNSMPEYVHWQRQLVPAMVRSQLNAAWPRIHVSYRPDQQKKGESDEEYKARIDGNFKNIVSFMENLDVDTNFVTFNNVTISVLTPGGTGVDFARNMQVLEEQMISGLHIVPMLIGRNYGQGGTWAEAQARLMERESRSAQRGAKRVLERLNDLALKLWGFPQYRTEVTFHPTNLFEAKVLADAEKTSWETGLAMRNEGLISQTQLGARMGLLKPFSAVPVKYPKVSPPKLSVEGSSASPTRPAPGAGDSAVARSPRRLNPPRRSFHRHE